MGNTQISIEESAAVHDKEERWISGAMFSPSPLIVNLQSNREFGDAARSSIISLGCAGEFIQIDPRSSKSCELVGNLFEEKQIVFHGGQSVLRKFLEWFHQIPHRIVCTETLQRVLDPDCSGSSSFPDAVIRHLGVRPAISDSGSIGFMREEGKTAIDQLMALWRELWRQVVERRLEEVAELEMQLLLLAVKMESTGLLVCRESLRRKHKALKRKRRSEVRAIANFGARGSGLAGVERTKDVCPLDGEPTTRGEREQSDLPKRDAMALSEIGQVSRWTGADDRVHPSFESLAGSEGHAFSHHPDLASLSPNTMRCVKAPCAHTFVRGKHIDPDARVLVSLADDLEFIAALSRGLDVSSYIASKLFGCSPWKALARQRHISRTILSCFLRAEKPPELVSRLLKEHSIELGTEEAERLQELFLHHFPALADYRKAIEATTTDIFETETLFGRKLTIDPEFMDVRSRLASHLSFPVLGTVSDAIKLAMVEIDETLHHGSSIVFQSGHEIIVQCPLPEVQSVGRIIHDAMAGQLEQFATPVPVQVEIGTNDHLGNGWLKKEFPLRTFNW